MENKDTCEGERKFSRVLKIKLMLLNLMNYFGAARILTLRMLLDLLQPDEIHPNYHYLQINELRASFQMIYIVPTIQYTNWKAYSSHFEPDLNQTKNDTSESISQSLFYSNFASRWSHFPLSHFAASNFLYSGYHKLSILLYFSYMLSHSLL